MVDGYPEDSPLEVSVEIEGGSNSKRRHLTSRANETAREYIGAEAALVVLHGVSDACEELEESSDAVEVGEADAATPVPTSLGVRMIWFHHIKSMTKRKFIVNQARALHLGGFSKHGFPGVVVVEGVREDCDEFVSSVRALRWKAMALRAEENIDVDPGTDLDVARRMALPFVEVGEEDGGMGAAAALCDAAGMHDVFAHAILKVRPTR